MDNFEKAQLFEDFRKLCVPVRDFMLKHYDLSCKTEITATSAKIFSDELGVRLKNPDNL